MGSLKVRQTASKNVSGLLTVESLTALGINDPVKLDKFITAEYRSNYGAGFSDILTREGKSRVVSKSEDGLFRWKLQGASAKSVAITECLVGGSAITDDTKVGIGKSTFQMVFPEPYFSDVMLISGEKGSREGQIRIMGDAIPYGTGWLYNCELIVKSADDFMSGDNFRAGKHFSNEYPLVEKTLSRKGAGFNYSGSYQMENSFSKIRFEETIPGNVFNRDTAKTWEFVATDDNGNTQRFTRWDSYKEYEQRMQMKKAKQKLLMNSRSNRSDSGNILNRGESGFSLDQGKGLEEQLEKGNFEWYTEFNITEFISFLYDLSDNTKGFGEKREVMVRTGKFGYFLAMQQIQEKASAFVALRTELKKGKDSGFELDYNFTSYRSPDGALITFYVDPTLDDPANATSKIRMSDMIAGLEGPATSYTYQVMNVGSRGGESNVEIVYVEQQNDYFGVINGIRSPYANVGGGIGSSVDGFSVHYMTPEMMVVIRDTSRCLTFMPAILQ